jgi:hypothetical protein
MALALYFSPTPAMSTAQYAECIKRLKKAGAGHPRGRVYHACFGTAGSVSVFDVWTSQAAFDKFGQTLMPILKELGVEPGQPSVMEIQNVIVPPPRPAAARRPSAKRAGAQKAATRSRKKR